MPVHNYVHPVCTGTDEDPLDLKLQAIVSVLKCILGMEPRSSSKALCILNYRAISPDPHTTF